MQEFSNLDSLFHLSRDRYFGKVQCDRGVLPRPIGEDPVFSRKLHESTWALR